LIPPLSLDAAYRGEVRVSWKIRLRHPRAGWLSPVDPKELPASASVLENVGKDLGIWLSACTSERVLAEGVGMPIHIH
jgi:hypothetical protein